MSSCNCSNELHIFANAKNMADDDDEFDYYFVVALMNGGVFSTIQSDSTHILKHVQSVKQCTKKVQNNL